MTLEESAEVNPHLVNVYSSYTDVTNLQWADKNHLYLNCTVNFEKFGPTLYTAAAEDITLHCPEIFKRAVAGEFGPIADYIPPTIEQVRSRMRPMSPRTFWKAARYIGIAKADIIAQINAITDKDDREEMLIDLEEATQFDRNDPTLIRLIATENITPEQLDDLWLHFTGE